MENHYRIERERLEQALLNAQRGTLEWARANYDLRQFDARRVAEAQSDRAITLDAEDVESLLEVLAVFADAISTPFPLTQTQRHDVAIRFHYVTTTLRNKHDLADESKEW